MLVCNKCNHNVTGILVPNLCKSLSQPFNSSPGLSALSLICRSGSVLWPFCKLMSKCEKLEAAGKHQQDLSA